MKQRLFKRTLPQPVSAIWLLLAGSISMAALAQEAPVKATPAQQGNMDAKKEGKADANSLDMHTVVVTGTSAKIDKFRTSYGVTSFNEAKLEQLKPQSAMSLFAEVPGVWAEGTGGENSGNLYVRGLPSNGGEKFVPLMQDGLPVYQEPEVGFMNADTFIRVSPMVERAEFVRGGPAAVLHSNATAGAFNMINRRGTSEWQGQLGMTWGNYNHLKTEGYVSGPINDRLSFAIGGYYRVDDGQRPPGFTANNGGELKTALTYRDHSTTASVYSYRLDDKTFFLTGLPFLNDTADTSRVNPKELPGLSLNRGTLASPDFQRVNLLTGNGPVAVDLSDGIHSKFHVSGAELFHDFENGWRVEERMRFTSGSNNFNAMFSGGTQPGTGVVAPVSSGPNANAFFTRTVAAFPTTTRLGLVYHNNPSETFDPVAQNGNGLVANQGWWTATITPENFINELRISKPFEAAGHHDLTGGLYFSHAKLHSRMNLNFGNLLTDTKSQPRALDLVGYDAAGKVTGTYTYNGFTSFGNYLNNVEDTTATTAFFVNDVWQVTPSLRLDAGVRHDRETIHTSFEGMTTTDLRGSAMVNGSQAVSLSNVGTLNGQFDTYSPSFSANSWTIGGNYEFSPQFAAFARYSVPERLPRTEDGWVASNRALQVTQKIKTDEVGLKVNLPTFSAFVTAYQTKDLAYPNYSYTSNAVTGVQTPILFMAKTRSRGIEFETVWRPEKGRFDIGFQGTFSRSIYTDFDQTFTSTDAFGVATTTHNSFTGKKIPHIPERMLSVTPSYKFNIADFEGKLYGTYRYSGARWLDAANTFKLPGFKEISLGAYVDVSEHFRAQLNVQNVTNSAGMTEGGCSLCGLTPSNSALGTSPNVFNGRPLLPRTVLVTGTYTF
jgi:outer membrane receptor protein involved in Fe transport